MSENSLLRYVIVTNSINRSIELVERSLRSSLNQEIPPKYLLFIDQNDSQMELDEKITSHPLFKRKVVSFKSVSAARNSINIEADVDWIVFCDDDGFLAPEYSCVLDEKTANGTAGIIAGSIIRTDDNNYYSPRHRIGGDLNKLINLKLLMGSNLVVRRKIFYELGGFDEQFGAGSVLGSGEETDFALKAHFSNVPMEYIKELIVYHEKPYDLPTVASCKKAFKYGVGRGALVFKWLFIKSKLAILYEVLDMIIVPFIRIGIGIFHLNFKEIACAFSSLTGRVYGFTSFILLRANYRK